MSIQHARSDDLVRLRALITGSSQLAPAIDVPLQLRVVIDTNVVLGDLLWLAAKRKAPVARTALQEVIDSSTVIAFVPHWLREEVEEHLPRLAEEEGIAEDRLKQIWQDYQPYLRFHAATSGTVPIEQPVADPNDLPFIWLAFQIGARAIVSRDRHIAAMGAAVVEPEIMLDLRDYARATSIALSIKLGAHGTTIMLAGSTYASVQLGMALIRGFARLPTWVQLALLVGAGIAALHPHSRAALVQVLHQGRSTWHAALARLVPLVIESLQTLGTEAAKATAARRRAEKVLSRSCHIPLETVVFGVYLVPAHP